MHIIETRHMIFDWSCDQACALYRVMSKEKKTRKCTSVCRHACSKAVSFPVYFSAKCTRVHDMTHTHTHTTQHCIQACFYLPFKLVHVQERKERGEKKKRADDSGFYFELYWMTEHERGQSDRARNKSPYCSFRKVPHIYGFM